MAHSPIPEYDVHILVLAEDGCELRNLCTRSNRMAHADGEYHDSIVGKAVYSDCGHILVRRVADVAGALDQHNLSR